MKKSCTPIRPVHDNAKKHNNSRGYAINATTGYDNKRDVHKDVPIDKWLFETIAELRKDMLAYSNSDKSKEAYGDNIIFKSLQEFGIALERSIRMGILVVNSSTADNLMQKLDALFLINLFCLKFFAEERNIRSLEKLLALGLHVHVVDQELGDTPLHIAAYQGNKKIVKLLIQSGENIDAQNREEETPLHNAVYGGQVDIVRLLLQEGANVILTDNKGKTPLAITFTTAHMLKKHTNRAIRGLLFPYAEDIYYNQLINGER